MEYKYHEKPEISDQYYRRPSQTLAMPLSRSTRAEGQQEGANKSARISQTPDSDVKKSGVPTRRRISVAVSKLLPSKKNVLPWIL